MLARLENNPSLALRVSICEPDHFAVMSPEITPKSFDTPGLDRLIGLTEINTLGAVERLGGHRHSPASSKHYHKSTY